MSDAFLKLISVNPQYVPDASAQMEARDLLASFLPSAERVDVIVTGQVRFIDPGANLQRVVCPSCASELDRRWWQGAMQTAAETGFLNLQIRTPCCGSLVSLNELKYDLPAGFARFVLEARNPVRDIRAEQILLISRVLKSEMKEIWAHY